MVWGAPVAPHSLRQILWCVVSSLMEPCRYDMGCWRPLCPYGHSGRRAVRWAALWSFLAMQEEGDENLEDIKERVHEHIVEQTVDVPVPRVTTKIQEVVEDIPQERIWCACSRSRKSRRKSLVPQIDDFLMPRGAMTSPWKSRSIRRPRTPSSHRLYTSTSLSICLWCCGDRFLVFRRRTNRRATR